MEEKYSNYLHSDVTEQVIKAAYYVFNYLGSGFLESVYEKSLELRIKYLGHFVKRQEPIKGIF